MAACLGSRLAGHRAYRREDGPGVAAAVIPDQTDWNDPSC